jgi:hypothetical protein
MPTSPLDPEELLAVLDRMTRAIDRLGLNREMADKPHSYPGALEKIAMEMKDGSERIADALNNVAEAIRDSRVK